MLIFLKCLKTTQSRVNILLDRAIFLLHITPAFTHGGWGKPLERVAKKDGGAYSPGNPEGWVLHAKRHHALPINTSSHLCHFLS